MDPLTDHTINQPSKQTHSPTCIRFMQRPSSFVVEPTIYREHEIRVPLLPLLTADPQLLKTAPAATPMYPRLIAHDGQRPYTVSSAMVYSTLAAISTATLALVAVLGGAAAAFDDDRVRRERDYETRASLTNLLLCEKVVIFLELIPATSGYSLRSPKYYYCVPNPTSARAKYYEFGPSFD